jgi:hypothetical protein
MSDSSDSHLLSRRDVLRGAVLGAAVLAVGEWPVAMARGAERPEERTMAMLDVTQFGAKGDGQTDDTAAIQKALDAAAKTQGTVLVPEGVFVCADLKVPTQVGLVGQPAWRYSKPGGSVLRLGDAKARCLLDITEANGATISGLSLDGQDLGEGVHGVLSDKPEYKTEDAWRIEGCQVGRFSGDGARLNRIWCYSIRHSMFCYNHGDGIWQRGWDGFLLDNWLSGNRGAGYGAREENAAMTITGNRIEWNRGGGLVSHHGNSYNLTGNYFDRSGGPAITLLGNEGEACTRFTMTGNIISRSGAPWRELDKLDSAQARFERCQGIVFTGNSLNVGRDDGNKGEWSPRCGIVYGRLENSVIKDNVLHRGALEELLVDLGGHGEGVIVKDNPGSVGTPW